MNRTEHLLVCLAEECAEVGQAVGKALRFGLADGYPGTDRTNAQDITSEVADLFAIVEMLVEYGAIQTSWGEPRLSNKKKKVEEFLRYAEERGTLVSNVEGNSAGACADPTELKAE